MSHEQRPEQSKHPTLQRSAAQDLLLAQFPAVAWTVDPQMHLTSWAGRVLKDLGYRETDLVGLHLEEFYATSPDPSDALAAHAKALAGEPADYAINWDGHDFKAHVEPLRAKDGTIIGCAGVGHDVTERTREATRVAKGTRFRLALTTLVEESLRRQLEDNYYQRVTEVATNALPGAQAGTIWLRGDDGNYHAAGAVGFDRDILAKVTFTPEEMRVGIATRDDTQADLEALLGANPETLARIRAAGPVDAIRVTLSLPISVSGDALAYLHLHNFERDEAFDEDEVQMARMFAGNLGLLIQRDRLERELREGNTKLERLLEDYKSLAAFAAEIETIHDTDQLIEHGMQRLLATLEFDAALLGEVKDHAVHFTRIRGMVPPELEQTVETPIPLGAGINGRVAQNGEPMFVQDYLTWADKHEAYLPAGVESMVALPIKRHGNVKHTIAFGTINRQATIDESDMRIASGFVARLENAFERVQHLEEIEATREATFRALGLALEYRDLETRGHTDRVVDLAERFADELTLDADQCQALAWGAYLHDIGKIAVPDTILLKPGKLTDDEFDIIRQHTVYGAEMTRGIPFLPTGTRQVVRSHHERWDGRGYPDNLAGNEIPLFARMFSLVDVYDALTSERPYKQAWSHHEAVSELQGQSGKQFEPELTRAFLSALSGLALS